MTGGERLWQSGVYARNGNVIKQVASDDDANVEDDENNSGDDSGDDNSGSGSGESNPL